MGPYTVSGPFRFFESISDHFHGPESYLRSGSPLRVVASKADLWGKGYKNRYSGARQASEINQKWCTSANAAPAKIESYSGVRLDLVAISSVEYRAKSGKGAGAGTYGCSAVLYR